MTQMLVRGKATHLRIHNYSQNARRSECANFSANRKTLLCMKCGLQVQGAGWCGWLGCNWAVDFLVTRD
jgi:hypothetical protein